MSQSQVLALYSKYKHMIQFLFFGGLSTLLNLGIYALCFVYLGLPNIVSTVLAWLGAVLFAYVTNRRWVFDSKARGVRAVLRELVLFFLARIFTGIVDVALMWLLVDVGHQDGMLMKLIANIVVVVLNYILSRWLIFASNDKKDKASNV